MRLLLDTHIWLWAAVSPERLLPRVKRALMKAEARCLSPVSLWEALLLAERGRIDLGAQPVEWLRLRLRESPMTNVPLDREAALVSRSLELEHEDPADRFLVATAIVHGLVLVTADQRLIEAAGIPTLANR